MRCRLSPTADVPSHTSGAAMGPLRDISRPLRGGFENWLSDAKSSEQRLGILQIERVEPFREPAVDRSEKSRAFHPAGPASRQSFAMLVAARSSQDFAGLSHAPLPAPCRITFPPSPCPVPATSLQYRRRPGGLRLRTIAPRWSLSPSSASPMQCQASSNWSKIPVSYRLDMTCAVVSTKWIRSTEKRLVRKSTGLTASEAFPVRGKYPSLAATFPIAFQKMAPLSPATAASSSASSLGCRVMPGDQMASRRRGVQDKHQSSGLANLAGGPDGARLDVRERCRWIAEQPRSPATDRPGSKPRCPGQIEWQPGGARPHCKAPPACLVLMHPSLFDVPRTQQGNRNDAMGDHDRDCRSLLLCKSQELRRKLAHSVAVERDVVRDPDGPEDRKQQQWVFGRLAQGFSLLDQQACLLGSRLGFGGGVAFDMDEWGDERDLKLDLLATQRRRAGQGRDLALGGVDFKDSLLGANQILRLLLGRQSWV